MVKIMKALVRIHVASSQDMIDPLVLAIVTLNSVTAVALSSYGVVFHTSKPVSVSVGPNALSGDAIVLVAFLFLFLFLFIPNCRCSA